MVLAEIQPGGAGGCGENRTMQRDFSDPMYHELAILNGEINKLKEPQLDQALQAFSLGTIGCHGVRQKRLKAFVRAKKQELTPGINTRMHVLSCRLDYLLLVDFEATCNETNPAGFLHEIIDFPMVLLDCRNRQVVAEFHEYVRPRLNPVLSPFCTQLTGITQQQVDAADTFLPVLERAQLWIQSQGLMHPGVGFSLACDGPWDICRFLVQQCMIDQICVPHWASRWVNVRKTFTNYYKLKYYPKLPNIEAMLEALGLRFEGRLHSGLADTRNLARVVVTLLADLCVPDFNEALDKYGYSWLLQQEPEPSDISLSPSKSSRPLPLPPKWRTVAPNAAAAAAIVAGIHTHSEVARDVEPKQEPVAVSSAVGAAEKIEREPMGKQQPRIEGEMKKSVCKEGEVVIGAHLATLSLADPTPGAAPAPPLDEWVEVVPKAKQRTLRK